jgi:crossover junction endodeoxyribonuclease RuvC
VLTSPPAEPLPARLASLAADLRSLLDELQPDVVAVERVVFQTAVRNAIPVAQAAGLAMALAHERGCEVVEYAANEVKLAVTGTGGASKEQVQKMVQALLRLPTPPSPPDAADALALALCHLARAPLAKAAG